jgi:hypothetical protein
MCVIFQAAYSAVHADVSWTQESFNFQAALRSEFPDKYVAIKRNRDGSQYVIVNQFFHKDD